MTLTISAVIAARDEEVTLAETVLALVESLGPQHLVVSDDGSRDRTPHIARALGAEVLPAAARGRGLGKGQALHTALLYVRARPTDAVLLLDADLGGSAALLASLLRSLDANNPVAVASFPPAGPNAGLGLVKGLARRAIARRTGFTPAEPLSGQRVLLTPVLEELPGIAPGFGAEVGMTLDLLAAGTKPLEVELPLTHRPTGRSLSGFAHRARQGLDVARALNGARIPW